MNAFVEYLEKNLAGKYEKPCGDRSIVILDGRRTMGGWVEDAHTMNGYMRPQYPHFRIMVGDFRSATEFYTTLGK